MCEHWVVFFVKDLRALADFTAHLEDVKKLAELKFRVMFMKTYMGGANDYLDFKQDLQVRQKVREKTGTQMQMQDASECNNGYHNSYIGYNSWCSGYSCCYNGYKCCVLNMLPSCF